MSEYYAHSANDDGRGVRETVAEHCALVAERAAQYARVFGAEQQARAAGLLHDLGKYADQFQRRLQDPQRNAGRNHWSAGALLLAACYKHLGIVPAVTVEGHHAGLQMLRFVNDFMKNMARRIHEHPEQFTECDLSLLKRRCEEDGFRFPDVREGFERSAKSAADMLDVRMLFSTLVDADFIETEAHFAGNAAMRRRYRPDGPELEPTRAFEAAKARIDELSRTSNAESSVLEIRRSLLRACLEAAERYAPGLFTLSAPTGAGKTLAMLAFALRHAIEHNLRRIVVVLPFLNIIEQTAIEYRRIFNSSNGFPEHYVIEDHSNVRPPAGTESADRPRDSVDEPARLQRLLSENWDAPVVITTSIQCLESLMSNRTGACRKLHRLAESVILFDEVQTLPPHLAVPTLATLSRLSERFGTTVVFATATQPAFDRLHADVAKFTSSGWQPTEIVPQSRRLFALASKRVRVEWGHRTPTCWSSIADALASCEEVLCIVNLTRHARRLAESLRDRDVSNLFHLSTHMCAAHRTDVLDRVCESLNSSKPVRLVTTQCVEAGVDLDFPVVYRALGPLDAIAQAAGRCNRHGSRPQRGNVHVFQPENDGKPMLPPGAYTQATEATNIFLASLSAGHSKLKSMEILCEADRLRAYYHHLYSLTGVAQARDEMQHALDACDFEDVARLYRLIAQDTINILVPYHRAVFNVLRTDIEETRPLTPKLIRNWMRRAHPHTVRLFRPKREADIWAHLAPVQFSRHRPVGPDEAEWFLALPTIRYDALLGFTEPESTEIFI